MKKNYLLSADFKTPALQKTMKNKSIFQRQLIKDCIIAVPLITLTTWAIIHFDIFNLFYEHTKSRELFAFFFGEEASKNTWSLKNILSVVTAILLVFSIMSIRHIIILRAALTKLDRARNALKRELKLKHQRQKLEALGQMAGGIAHEINNTLQPISAYGELLQRKYPDDATTQKYASSILRSAKHAEKIVDTVLSVSRREQDVNQTVTDIHNLIKECKSHIKGLQPENIQTSYKLSNKKMPIQFDETTFIQVTLNFIKNAFQSMPEGGKVTLKTSLTSVSKSQAQELELEAGDYAAFSIQDTGCGMDEKTQERIFTPFFTTKEAGQGTGLGLSLAYNIIQGAGGQIHVESQPQKGSTFTIYLPVL